MKHLAYLYKIIGITCLILFLLPQIVFADDTSVDSQSTGQSIHCVNGNCTSTGGGSKTTVCHNGQCSTTDDGNVDYSSPDGHTKIHVHNNTSGNSVSNSPEPTGGTTDVSPVPTDTPMPSITPDPTITQMRNDINKHVQQEIEGVKEHVKDQNAALSDFIKTEMESLQNLLNNLFH